MPKLFACLVVCIVGVACFSDDSKSTKPLSQISQEFQDISVTILARNTIERAAGSGVIKTRKLPSGESVSFVWTAAHTIEGLRIPKKIIDVTTGFTKTKVEFDDCIVVKPLNQDGRYVGKIEFLAQIIRYDRQEDLAILKIRKKDFSSGSVKFYQDKELIPLGTRVWHVGSLLGEIGSNSMTEGVLSQHGRIIDRKVFDQVSAAAFPGSSGGGVFLNDGRMIGMVTKGIAETFHFTIPAYRMREWSRNSNVEWAFDDQIPMISEQELKKLPVEDNGIDVPPELPSLEKILGGSMPIIPIAPGKPK